MNIKNIPNFENCLKFLISKKKKIKKLVQNTDLEFAISDKIAAFSISLFEQKLLAYYNGHIPEYVRKYLIEPSYVVSSKPSLKELSISNNADFTVYFSDVYDEMIVAEIVYEPLNKKVSRVQGHAILSKAIYILFLFDENDRLMKTFCRCVMYD